ncbi:pentapeptide repeat-containing protein [Paenibacillus alvei]|uniref:Pentapeptide repeat-containing protein n=1 Tax=Paenibacillus alvei TaxID=44250 RepID=A0ABT4GYZ0_PAEAL|nr:pentapeptide repeat-containing protein [Paenibacillus alvei]MCY9761634.1 pentapeptide repeat-containing protein [Paenibacillus alvei]MCY9769675.1 pentapeptide repeat-containing protein [Paenibacillus alvei]
MDERLRRYLDSVFSPYEDLKQIQELKEELLYDLQEKLSDLKKEGYDDEAAYLLTIESIGEISELIESINSQTVKLQQKVGMDFSKSNLQNSDFTSTSVDDGQFNYSNLQGSDFSYSDLTNSSFKCSSLDQVNFTGANLSGAQIVKSSVRKAIFTDCIFENTIFKSSDFSGVSFDNLTFNGVVFDYAGLRKTTFRNAVFNNVSFKTDVKKTIFDGATMDKLTYALLKSNKADLSNVTVR